MTSAEKAAEAKGALTIAQSKIAAKDAVGAIRLFYEASGLYKTAFDESRAEGKTNLEFLNLAKSAFEKGQRLENLITTPPIQIAPRVTPTTGGNAGSDMPLYSPKPMAIDANSPNTIFLENVKGLAPQKRTIKIAIADLLAARESGQTREVGVLLYGPPGTGKTMLARAIAAECARGAGGNSTVYFFNLEATEIKNPYVGMTIKNLKNCFDEARKSGEGGASVLFFDELDALTSTQADAKHDTEVSKILQIELDGLKERGSIIPVGATNRPFNLPFELLREGRFGTPIFIPPPDLEARVAIFEQLITKETSDYFSYGGVDLQHLGKLTDGYSGADIKGVIRAVVRAKTGNLIQDIDKKSIYDIKEDLVKLRAAKRQITAADFETAVTSHRSTLPIWYTQVKTALQLAPKEVRQYFSDLVAVVEAQTPGSISSSPPPPAYVSHGVGADMPADDVLQRAILEKRDEVTKGG
ncbi:MAG: ATP-binding protein [DPANN group archaeon]|nr:ATP-binding protein [DPANN group archaeon]